MSFLYANSGDYRNASLDEQFERALASVHRMAQDYAAAQNKALLADLATAIADRDQCRSQCEALHAALERISRGHEYYAAKIAREALASLSIPTHPARSSADDCAKP